MSAPTVPTGIAAGLIAGKGGAARITFTRPSTATGYSVQVYTTANTLIVTLTFNQSGAPVNMYNLTGGQTVKFKIAAFNSIGTSAYSAYTATVTPTTTVPDALTITGGSENGYASTNVNDARALMFISPVLSNGGRAVTGYGIKVYLSDGTFVKTHEISSAEYSGSGITVSGLNWSTTYKFKAFSRNEIGPSADSAFSANITTGNPLPTIAPTISSVALDNDNRSVSINFNHPGVSDMIAHYVRISTYSSSDVLLGSTSTMANQSPTFIPFSSLLSDYNVLPGSNFKVTVSAVNAYGAGPESTKSDPLTAPLSVPDAPSISSLTRGDGNIIVSVTPPANTGGVPINSYVVKAYLASDSSYVNISATGSSSPITVSDLTNGMEYKFTVLASNSVGDGAESGFSSAIIPAKMPFAPSITSAIFGNSSVTVSFDAPSNAGESGVTSYAVNAYLASGNTIITTTSDAGSPIIVTGLTNGTAYKFTVVGINVYGEGTPSGFSEAVTPRTVPNPPSIVSVTRGDGEISVAFNLSDSDGGATISDYTVKAYTASDSVYAGKLATGLVSPLIVSGLTNGTEYFFKLYATNSVGNSDESGASAAIIPAKMPLAPTILSVTPSDGKLTVSFNPSSNEVDSGVTGYEAVAYLVADNSFIASYSGFSPIEMSGLQNGMQYYIKLRANNAYGSSPEAQSSSAIPASVPAKPSLTALNRKPVSTSIDAVFSPAGDGGLPITNYVVKVYLTSDSSYTGISVSGASSPITVTNLTLGTDYTFKVSAENLIGISEESDGMTIIPVIMPTAPTNVSATARNSGAKVFFDAPSNAVQSGVTEYAVNVYRTSDMSLIAVANTLSSPVLIPNLTNGQEVVFKVYASNQYGSGPESAQSSPVTPSASVTPTPPIIDSVTIQDSALTVAFSPPLDDMGHTIGGYYASLWNEAGDVYIGGGHIQGTSPITISGLNNGVIVRVRIEANTISGSSSFAFTNPVSPMTNMAVGQITPGDSSVTVNVYAANSWPGDSTMMLVKAYLASDNSYTGISISATFVDPTGALTQGTITVSGLTNGTAYKFTVTPYNTASSGIESAFSDPATPVSPNPGGAILADPYVTTPSGMRYKLPSIDAPIRVFQGDVDGKTLTINAQLRTTPNTALLAANFRSYFDLKSKVPAAKLKTLEKSVYNTETLCFFEKFYISYNGVELALNVWDQKFVVESYTGGELPVRAVDGAHLTAKYSDIYKGYSCKTLKFQIGRSAAVFVSVYDSPMLRNGIFLEGVDMTAGNGVMVNVLNSKDMTLATLDSTAPVEKRDARVYVKSEIFIDKDGYREKKIYVTK